MKNVCGRTTPVSLPLVVVTVELLHELLSKFKSWWLSETASSRWWDIPALPYSTDKSFSHFANQFKLRSGFDSDFWPKERVVQNRFCRGEEITPSGRSITLNLEFTNVTLRSSLKIFQDGEPVHCRFLLQNQLSTWPVLWILFPDCSCDPLTCPPEFHPGQRDLPLRKGAVLSWQGWKGARQFAPHLAVHALCDRAINRPEQPSPVAPQEEAEDFRATDSGVRSEFLPECCCHWRQTHFTYLFIC